MTDDPLTDAVEFALVFAVSVGATLTSFSLWELLGRRERDKGPGR